MLGSAGLQMRPRRRLFALAIVIPFLLLPASRMMQAHAQQSPPDDAPAESFPAEIPAPGQGPAAPLQPQPAAPPMIGGGIWLPEGPGPAIFGQVEGITPGPNEVSIHF